MPDVPGGFVQLDRSFHELGKQARSSDSFDLNQAFFVGPRLTWDDLLKGYRTVILSEAGTGKTEEIRQAAKRLRAEGKRAFFLRLEHIPEDFEEAFEVGTIEEFTAWLASTEDGWLLLDSVDEARLRSPGDFERAIRKFGRRIQTAIARARIVLAGRTGAWRAKTDLELCERHLPITPETTQIAERVLPEEGSQDAALDQESFDTEDADGVEISAGFRIVALDDLSPNQIDVFARARGVTNTQDFLEEIERAEAQSFTTRPQDLEELVEFWNKERRIGTRFELMMNSVQRRLEERDQNRREAHPLSDVVAREGARLLAAASLLGKEPTIQVADGSHNNKGIPVQRILPDWNERDQKTLLSRPIFDEAIYGTVRFHHRSVREFLAADWLANLLERSGSRRKIEALLFRVQYGVEVVVPTMRPVLPWLAIADQRIRERTLRIAPEVLFEGGDPSALPLPTRKALLAKVCKEIASGKSGRSALEYAAVQRFANPDLADDIRALLKSYASSPELVSFLIRMVWLGRLYALKDEAKALALVPSTSRYTRTAAIRALRAVGTSQDLDDLRSRFLSEASELGRDWLGEIVAASSPTPQSTKWLLEALANAAPKERFVVDPLADSVVTFVEIAPTDLLPRVAEGLNHLLNEPPFVERGYCDVSSKNSWLIKPASIAVERLITARRAEALAEPALGILHKFRAIRDWDDELRDVKAEFGKLVPAWKELNRTAFWHDVRETRQSAHFVKQNQRLTNFWQASVLGAHWDFGLDDFDYAAEAVRTLDDQDDKLIALSLAFDIYVKGNRPPPWRDRLHELVRDNAELEERLGQMLNPPASEFEREERKWKKRAAARERRERDNRAKSKDFILANIELVRAPHLPSPTDISSAQWYLHEYLREKGERGSRWTVGRWRELIPEFGEAVAKAYREGVTSYWRRYRPTLRSEGAPANSTPIFVIFGLAGLDIEAAETPNWPSNLSKDEVLLACRYAAHELNGFPPWFPKLFEAYPEVVGDFLLSEIKQGVLTEGGEESHYLLSDVSWSGQWAWDRLASTLLGLLQGGQFTNLSNLGMLLTIVQGSRSVSDDDLAALAKSKSQLSAEAQVVATWFAAWVGVAPEDAVPALKAHLASIADPAQQTHEAMVFVTTLLGGRRRETGSSRRRFVTPKYLKELFLLMQQYVREDEDIDRVGGGVYSPGLRDEAQDARNALFNLLKEIPGKEAFVALSEIAALHPKADSRPWLASYAQSKAEQDADLAPWSPAQVRDFHEHLDRTPTNHRELADLVITRLLDLKDDLENGDDSVARLLQRVEEEPEMRNFLAHELRAKALGRFTVTQEEELADYKRPDLRFHGAGFDAPVPAELKLAERWTGPKLFERLEGQLSGDYLRDNRSARGIFVLVNRTAGRRWQVPSGEVHFDELLEALRAHWKSIANDNPHVEDLTVLGIDLSKRFE